MKITAKLGRNLKDLVRKRHKLRIKSEKRCVKVSWQVLVEQLREFHTFMQVQQRFQNFKYTGKFDQAPVGFSGELVRTLVVHAEDGDCSNSTVLGQIIERGSSPACHLSSSTLTIQMRKWSNLAQFVFSRGRALCMRRRSICTHQECKFGSRYRLSWTSISCQTSTRHKSFKKAGDPRRALVGDSCKAHLTATANAKLSRMTSFGRIGENCTSLTQYLVTDHLHVFKHHYRTIFTPEVEPKLKG